MARNWYTAEVGEVKELRSLLTALRNLDAVFDAYRVHAILTPQAACRLAPLRAPSLRRQEPGVASPTRSSSGGAAVTATGRAYTR